MIKTLFLLPLFSLPLFKANDTAIKNNGFILDANERGNYTLVGVEEKLYSAKEIKIYYDEDKIIDEVDDSAFINCYQLETIVLSYSVIEIHDEAFIDSINTIKYTGSFEQYSKLGILKEFENLSYYASDEGFINYWDINIRPEKESNICGISTTTYQTLYALYTELTISEREIVDSTSDKAGIEIKQSMKVLKDTFQQTPSPSNSGTTWNQKGAISFIIIVAVIGMTSICVFYLMKTKQIID